jgi:opacity protein-like surface antigen
MRSVKQLSFAGAAMLLSATAAAAADLPPVPVYKAPMMVEQPYGGWYLRGDIGMTNQQVKSLDNVVSPGSTVTTQFLTFDSAPLFGLGVGYQVNNWLRFDATGEYRAKAHFHGSQVVNFGPILPDDYNASKSEWLALANVYLDLGTWWGITPFIGAGVGGAYNKISSFTDIGATQAGATILSTTYGADAGTWNFAWAAHAGLAYQVTRNLAIELAYRYVDLGSAKTGPTNSFDGVTLVNGTPFQFKDITSHDLKLGVRWMFDAEPMYAPPPLVRKG